MPHAKFSINKKTTTSKDWAYTYRWLLRRQTELNTTKIDSKPEKWFKKEFVEFVSDLLNNSIFIFPLEGLGYNINSFSNF